MSLKLYGHPFSSYTQQVLMALYENQTPFEFCPLGPNEPGEADFARLWPTRRMPLLSDADVMLRKSSVIIEYLSLRHAGPITLLPADPLEALDVRFLDRFFDLNVMTPSVKRAIDKARPCRGYFPPGAPDRD